MGILFFFLWNRRSDITPFDLVETLESLLLYLLNDISGFTYSLFTDHLL